MASTKKLSQHQLRQLMREKALSKVVKRIDSPLAKYDQKGNLSCAICSIVIHSETYWPAHLLEKAHKKKIDELKQLRQPKPASLETISNNKSKKRRLDEDKTDSKKTTKFEKISEFSKKEILIKQKFETVHISNEDQAQDSVPEDTSLPQDFFDTGVTSVKTGVQQNTIEPNFKNDSLQNSLNEGALPKGFFDDPLLDARSRKGKNVKDPFEEQMELFRKEIAQESIVSEVILEEEIEQIQKEKTIAEIEEQISNWEKVDEYQKKIESIHKKLEDKTIPVKKDDDDDSDDDDANLDDMHFWRSKGTFH